MEIYDKTKYEHIPAEKFAFVQDGDKIHDKELQTKARSFFADAMIRFSKNKSSVVAAWILLGLLLFSFLSPILSPYSIKETDKLYVSYPPYVEWAAKHGIENLSGARIYDSQNEAAMSYWKGIAVETGMDPVLGVLNTYETEVKYRGKLITRYTYDIKVNAYYALGVVYRVFSYDEFQNIQNWQNKTGIQVIYPYVDPEDISGISDTPNIWYKVDSTGEAVLDKDGNFVPMYCTKQEKAGAEYNSLRIAGDDGSYIYSAAKSGSVQCRIDYYNYYTYLFGHEPRYIFGTNSMGMDLFAAIGIGARFSLVFAILVSAINLTLGAIYGSIEGYYGGAVDMILERFSDILSGVPFIVVMTLLQYHFAGKLGVVPTFLLAYVATGWIGMAGLTRKQFYRFKGQEYIMAARTLGASDKRLMFKHIFPNAIGTIITSVALVIPGVISSETSLTYLGIVDLSSFAGTTIGTLLSQGNASVTTAPHAMLWPSIFVGLLMISFNLFGNGLRDAFNPTTRGVED